MSKLMHAAQIVALHPYYLPFWTAGCRWLFDIPTSDRCWSNVSWLM